MVLERAFMAEHYVAATPYEITDGEYSRFQAMLHGITGISLGESKKSLVVSRLARRLSTWQLQSFTQYLHLLEDGAHRDELQMAVDLLTTNETYFFREENHFRFLQQQLAAYQGSGVYRVWSAACSNGQEAYSIAMVLEDSLRGKPWEIMGSDISTRVIDVAQRGQYPLAQADKIPREYLGRFCLKGVGGQDGTFLIDSELRRRTRFFHGNLLQDLQGSGTFDIIFLRNVLIYFDIETKRKVIRRLLGYLKRGGHLLIGHSESLNGVTEELRMLSPSIYLKS